MCQLSKVINLVLCLILGFSIAGDVQSKLSVQPVEILSMSIDGEMLSS